MKESSTTGTNPRELEVKVASYYNAYGFMSERTHPGAKYIKDHYVSNNWDFFNCFDGISVKEGSVILWQACSGTTFRVHKKKIEKLFPFTIMPVQELDYFYKSRSRWHFSITRRTRIGWQYIGDVECATNTCKVLENDLSISMI